MTAKDPRLGESNPARSWVAIVPDDNSYPYIGFDVTTSETHGSECAITDHAVENGSDITDNMRVKPNRFGSVVYVTNTPVINPDSGMTPANVPGVTAVSQTEVAMPPLALITPPGAPLFTPGGLFQAAEQGIATAAIALGLSADPLVKSFYPTTFGDTIFDAVKATFDALTDIQNRSITMTVFTSVEAYENMGIESITMVRDHVGGAEIAIGWKQITTVETATTTAPKPTPVPTSPSANPPKAGGSQFTQKAPAPPTGQTSVAAKQLGL